MSRFIRSTIVSFILSTLPTLALASGGADDATKASGAALSTIAPAAASATVFGAKCPAPGGQWACPLAALSIAQTVASLLNSGASKSSAAALTSTAGTGGSTGTAQSVTGLSANNLSGTGTNADVAALTALGLGSLAAEYQAAKNAVANSGVSVSPDGSKVTLANGKTVSSSSLGSAEGLKNAGFSDSDLANMQDAMGQIGAKLESVKSKVATLTNDAGGGGGGAGGAGGAGGRGELGDSAGGNPFAMGRAGSKNGKGVSGLSKKLGSDSIGVSGDDIFQMITRRYQARDKVDSFLKN